jgi:hypothetical protein
MRGEAVSDLTLPFSGGTDNGGVAFNVTESSGGIAVKGSSFQQGGRFDLRHTRFRPDTAGVSGESDGYPGVYGKSQFDSGVEGESATGAGVLGHSRRRRGVMGHSSSLDGVQGISDKGTGVFGEGARHGVRGKSGGGSAVYGEHTAGGDGVTGTSASGTGVAGVSASGNGVYGRSDGAFGKAGYFEGDVIVTGDICLENADCAEDFAVLESATATPGAVMVLSDNCALASCKEPYDPRVAGVVSGAGDSGPAIILGRGSGAGDRRPIALIGKTYCKVDAAFGPISIGDLLTTSPTPGHAMRASDPARAVGATVGKAMGSLDRGRGLIPVLVSLR